MNPSPITSSPTTRNIWPNSGTARTSTAPGRGSPTSRSRSRSSPSWPAASPTSRRLQQRRPDRHLVGLADPHCLHPDHRHSHVRAGVGVPDVRRHLLVGLQARRPRAGFFTGWLNLIGLVAIVASVCLRLRDVHRPHDRLLQSSSYADNYSLTRVFIMFVIVLALAARAEHLQQPPDGDDEQRLGVVARGRRDRDRADPVVLPQGRHHHARSATCSTRARQQHRAIRRRKHERLRVLALHRCRCPASADAVHDHRVRRLRPPVRGDPAAASRARPRASGARSSTPASAAASCCCRSFAIQNKRRRRQRAGRRQRVADLRAGAGPHMGGLRCCSSRRPASSSARWRA